jgi:spore germination protein YaaH
MLRAAKRGGGEVVAPGASWYDCGVTASALTRKPRRRVRGLLIVALILLAGVLRACVLRPATNYSGGHFNTNRNAAWLGVEWSMEPHSAEQVAALASDLQTLRITTIYVYVSYLKPDGVFNPTYDHAAEFVTNLKAVEPSLDVQAWLGIPLKAPEGAPLASGYINLSDATSRTTIADFSRFAVNDLSFDGVHLDPEPIVSGDALLLALLDEVRTAIGPRARLSISAREITPLLPEADLIFNRWFTWRADYYREIAARVDQIAVMAYDSHAPSGWLYEQWVRFQAIALTTSLRASDVKVLVGIPTSEERTPSHNPDAENMATGLTGLIAGLNDLDSQPEVVTGVAIYPYWETSGDEWAVYQSLWLGQSK